MKSAATNAEKIAGFLLDIGAIRLQPDKPFTWASGWKSPIYCDNRLSLSYPEIRKFITTALSETIREEFGMPDVIAGVATAAIPQGALVAGMLDLPFVYVRSSPKDHGRENLIEGHVESGQRVVVIEDLVSTGMSSLKAVKALREQGCTIEGMISIFTYSFPFALENFRKEDCRLVSLCNYETLLETAMKRKSITSEEAALLKSWREDPANWNVVVR